MKIRLWAIAMILLLTACQSQAVTGTPVAPSNVPTSAPTKAGNTAIINTPAPTIALTAAPQPVIHSSSTDPNAPNLIVVRDQPLVNVSVTMDLVRAAQPGWLVIYLSKNQKPGHRLGYVAVQAGTIQQLNVPLDPNAGVSLTSAVLAGKQLFAILQAGAKAPGVPVEVAGRSVLEPFTVLPSNP